MQISLSGELRDKSKRPHHVSYRSLFRALLFFLGVLLKELNQIDLHIIQDLDTSGFKVELRESLQT